MKNTLKYFNAILLIVLYGCGAENVDFEPIERLNVQGNALNVAVIDTLPTDLQNNVKTNQVLKIAFSNQILRDSINSVTVRVENDSKALVEGKYELNDNLTVIQFYPVYDGRRTVFDTATTYKVTIKFLKDIYGAYVGSYTFKFRTEDFSDESGALKIVNISPKSFLILPNSAFTVTFSAPIKRNLKIPICMPSASSPYSEAFQFLVLDPNSPRGSSKASSVKGEICLNSPSKNGEYTQLIFMPEEGWPEESMLYVRIRDTSDLRSESGGRLNRTYEEWRMAVFNLF